MGAALVLLLVGLGALAAGVLIGRYYVPDDRQLRRGARHSRAYVRALSHLVARDHDGAVSELRTVVEESVEDVEPYFVLGALFRSRGEHERAIRVHQALAVRERDRKKLRQRAMYELGLDFRAAGMPRRATRALEEVLADDPSHDGVLRALAALYEEQARFSEAAELWQRLGKKRDEDTSQREHHLLAAAAQAAVGRDELDAARQLLKAAHKRGASAHYLVAAAELAARRGRHDDARDRLVEAIVVEPRLAPHLLAGLIAAVRGGMARDAGPQARGDDLDADALAAGAATPRQLAAPPADAAARSDVSERPAAELGAASGVSAAAGGAAAAVPTIAGAASASELRGSKPRAGEPASERAAQRTGENLAVRGNEVAAPRTRELAATPASAADARSTGGLAATPASAGDALRTEELAATPASAADARPTGELAATPASAADARPTGELAATPASAADALRTGELAATPASDADAPPAGELAARRARHASAIELATVAPRRPGPPDPIGAAAQVPRELAESLAARVLGVISEIEAQTGPRIELALIRAQLIHTRDPEALAAEAEALTAQFPDALPARVAVARLALATGDPGAIRDALAALAGDGGALAWALRGRWQCARCGHRPGPFGWRCGQCRRWGTLRVETGSDPLPPPARERREAPRVARPETSVSALPEDALRVPARGPGPSELASSGGRRSLLERIGGWMAARRGAP
jgi:lipopolysaccharide assembly protein B